MGSLAPALPCRPMEPRVSNLPERTRTYENHHLDSPRWDEYETRPGDIIVTTAYKSGTTWTQTIVANLIFQDGEIPGAIMDISPWVDMAARPFDDIVERTGAQTHRRFLKTHLPLDGLPYKRDVRYVYCGRDLRDVFMSLWNHYRHHTPAAYTRINDRPGRVGDPFPPCPDDIHTLWRDWITRGWFDWESEGYPFWSASHHARTWFDYRHLPNILFVHFADLLAEPSIEIQRIADFLGIEVTPTTLERIVEATRFDAMKAKADGVVGAAAPLWDEGGRRFLNKGTNGRWRGILTDAELAQYRDLIDRSLSPECASWLENGRGALFGAANP
jgi:aryl sulfotransferase